MGSEVASWEPKSTQDRLKFEVQDGVPLSIGFLMDWGGFWEQNWKGKSTQDRSKFNTKGHQKNDKKKRPLGSV